MEIVRKNIDDLNAVLTINLAKEDYRPEVDNALKVIRKKTDIKGFRKGQVPMGMIKKQYEDNVLFEEVNKKLQSSVQNYIQEEKIEILGYPLPVQNNQVDWKADTLSFDFELGLVPSFDVSVKETKVDTYKVVVNDTDLEEQIVNITKSYGEQTEVDTVSNKSIITIQIKENEEEAKEGQISFDDLSEEGKKAFEGKKVAEVVSSPAKTTFKDDFVTMRILSVGKNEIQTLDKDLDITIKEVKDVVPAELNQEFFDKIYKDGEVSSVEDFKGKIREEAEKFYQGETDKYLFNKIVDTLVEDAKFELPTTFLKKFILNSSEAVKTVEEAEAEFAKSEKGMRYQLIEGKVSMDAEIKVTAQEVETLAKEQFQAQMAQYGGGDLPDEQLDQLVANYLQNEEQHKQFFGQVFNKKMFDFYKENVTLNETEVSFKEFVEVISK